MTQRFHRLLSRLGTSLLGLTALWVLSGESATAHLNCPTVSNIYGTDANNYLEGDGGGDADHDHADHIFGGLGDDTILGYTCRDQLYGDGGKDEVHGAFGSDTIDGGPGDDNSAWGGILVGGGNDDDIWGNTGGDDLTDAGGSGDVDEMYGQEQFDIVNSNDGDIIDTLRGGPPSDGDICEIDNPSGGGTNDDFAGFEAGCNFSG
jgi:Ca2+-binding RTX toxin-like protein